MSLKKTCAIWALVFLGCAALVGFLCAHRLPIAALPGGVIGGGLLWLAFAYFFGIFDKWKKAQMIRRAIDGATPRDARIAAALGRIVPSQETLTSPIGRKPCVIYTYEMKRFAGRNA